MESFSETMKAHLLDWAKDGGIDVRELETRHGVTSWVLREEHKRSNLYSDDWWRHIEGKEHKWARALNSSQCFAVNLFAPLAEDPALARDILSKLSPEFQIGTEDRIAVRFEYTPEGAMEWMGEREHATQVDVAFEVWRNSGLRAATLVEVKFTETGFGSCRGYPTTPGRPSLNPDPSRCLSVGRIRIEPEKLCWLAQKEQRTYWTLLRKEHSSFDLASLAEEEPCPFRGGLYQIMRNTVLADELARRHNLDWSQFALCIHPGNDTIWRLAEPIAGSRDVRAAMSSLMLGELPVIDPCVLVKSISEQASGLHNWATYMKRRYRLQSDDA